jgi:hypothetical protein
MFVLMFGVNNSSRVEVCLPKFENYFVMGPIKEGCTQ